MKAVHVQLANERRDISMFEILPTIVSFVTPFCKRESYERTFEKSLEGDIRKLSSVGDHDIR